MGLTGIVRSTCGAGQWTFQVKGDGGGGAAARQREWREWQCGAAHLDCARCEDVVQHAAVAEGGAVKWMVRLRVLTGGGPGPWQ